VRPRSYRDWHPGATSQLWRVRVNPRKTWPCPMFGDTYSSIDFVRCHDPPVQRRLPSGGSPGLRPDYLLRAAGIHEEERGKERHARHLEAKGKATPFPGPLRTVGRVAGRGQADEKSLGPRAKASGQIRPASAPAGDRSCRDWSEFPLSKVGHRRQRTSTPKPVGRTGGTSGTAPLCQACTGVRRLLKLATTARVRKRR